MRSTVGRWGDGPGDDPRWRRLYYTLGIWRLSHPRQWFGTHRWREHYKRWSTSPMLPRSEAEQRFPVGAIADGEHFGGRFYRYRTAAHVPIESLVPRPGDDYVTPWFVPAAPHRKNRFPIPNETR